MKTNHLSLLLVVCGMAAVFSACQNTNNPTELAPPPHLEKKGNATQLIVEGKPFIILGGEFRNSSSSSVAFMDTLWAPTKEMNLNTVLAVVSWQTIEPEEGKFDFSLVDAMLEGARKNDLKLVVLWFGSWKNGLSHYVPDWVKNDTRRFPRVTLENGKPTETLTAINSEGAKADAKAFAELMAYIKKVDALQQTVIMIQVENEVGVLGSPRDYSPLATESFNKPVPEELINALVSNNPEMQPDIQKYWKNAGSKNAGTWEEVFGKNTFAEEAFMAWNYANYVNTVALAGKASYDIPMFVNAWIVQPEDKRPGDYPAGGPQSHVHDIWRIFAPAIDIKAPDIYLPDFKGITGMYHHPWNPLFVPESFAGTKGAANAFFAIGERSGIGYSPFGFDGNLTNPSQKPLAKAYRVLNQLMPEILDAQANNAIRASYVNTTEPSDTLNLGGYNISFALRTNHRGVSVSDEGYGLIIHKGPDEFIVAGAGMNVVFTTNTPGPKFTGIASVYEGKYENGEWVPGRLLNGDDIMVNYHLLDEAAAYRTGTAVTLNTEPGIYHVKLYRFE
ncbi:MAG: DUF5597 domain-containing protein [Bacteroidales bacterium]